MKKKSLIAVITLAVMSIYMLGCGNTNKNANNTQSNKTEQTQKDKKGNYPVTITNYTGDGKEYKVTFNEKPQRIITTNQPPTELLITLGLDKYMVGTAYLDNSILPHLKDKYDKIPVLSKQYPSKEVIIAQKPDFIMGWSSAFNDKAVGTVESLNEKGIKTFIQTNSGYVKPRTIENVYKDISDIGKIFDIEDRANKIIGDMKGKINDIQSKIKKIDKPIKVLVLDGQGDKYRFYGENSLVNDMIKKVGGINLEKKGGLYGVEGIVDRNPDVIVFVHYETQSGDKKDIETLTKNPALKNVNAIKNKKIVYTPLAEVYAGGIRTINGIERLAKGFYPEIFK